MPGFNRSQLKSTSLTALQTQQKDHESKRPSGGFDKNYLEIKLGDNKFRAFPFHPDSGIDTYSVPKCVSFLTVTKPKRDDKGNKIEGEFELKRSPIFNSKVHGNLPKDLVEEFMNVAKQIAIPNFTDDQKLQTKIWNYFTYAGKGSQAIKPSDTWVMYAMKEEGKDKDGNSIWSKPGLLEVKKTVANLLTEKAIEFSKGGVQTPDIYTDPDDGIAFTINKSGEGKDTEYKVSLNTVTVKEGNRFISESVPTKLTDDVLDEWFKLDSLAKLYVNSYKRSDFEYQLEGLERFDKFLAKEGYPINVFSYSEFQDVVDELFSLLPEEQSQDSKEASVEEEKQSKQPAKTQRSLVNKPSVNKQQEEVKGGKDMRWLTEDTSGEEEGGNEEESQDQEEAEEIEVQQTVATRGRPRKNVEAATSVSNKPKTATAPATPSNGNGGAKSTDDRLAEIRKRLGRG